MSLPPLPRPTLQPTTVPDVDVAEAVAVLERVTRRLEEAAAERAAATAPALQAWEGRTARLIESDHDAGQRAAERLADDLRVHAQALRACADEAADLRHHRRVAHDRVMDAWAARHRRDPAVTP